MNDRYAFAGYVLDTARGSLERSGREVKLRPQSFQVLKYLVEHRSRLVSKTELTDAVWGDAAVTDDSLVQCLHDIRRALNDTEQRLIETVPRRGYRFAAPVLTAVSSIAVLPFVDISPEPERTAYFSEGLTEELITALARVPGLRVAARSASFRFRGPARDLRRVRDELRVGAVIEGSVRIVGAQLRVTVQLVDVAEESSLWSETYEKSMGDIFAIQEEICCSIVAHLPVKPLGAGRPLVRRYTENVEAYQLYLTGRYFWNRRSHEGFQKAIDCWNRAIALDPGYPLSYVGVADAHVLLAYFGHLDPHVAFATVAAAAKKAVAIDADLAEARVSLGNLKLHYEWDLEAAQRELRTAMSLDPSYAYAPHILSHYWVAAGDIARSLEASQHALDLAPLDLVYIAHLGWHYYHAGDYERAAATCRRALEMESRFVMARIYLGQIYSQSGQWAEALVELETALAQGGSLDVQGCVGFTLARAGRHEEARALLATLRAEAARRYVSPYRLATIHLALGEREDALALLERAVDERACAITYLKTDPVLAPLHGDRRFAALLARVWRPGDLARSPGPRVAAERTPGDALAKQASTSKMGQESG